MIPTPSRSGKREVLVCPHVFSLLVWAKPTTTVKGEKDTLFAIPSSCLLPLRLDSAMGAFVQEVRGGLPGCNPAALLSL
jgi:hypothetical protein